MNENDPLSPPPIIESLHVHVVEVAKITTTTEFGSGSVHLAVVLMHTATKFQSSVKKKIGYGTGFLLKNRC